MNDNQKETTEKLYTQKELEEILAHRLSRERKNTESLQYIRDALTEFRKNEPYKSLSNARLAEIVVDMAKNNIGGEALDTAEKSETSSDVPEEEAAVDSAEYNGDLPENTPLAENLNQHYDTGYVTDFSSTKPVSENSSYGQEDKISEVAEFLVRFGESCLNDTINDRAFKAFCSGKSGTLCSLYESYKAFLSVLSQSPEAKKYRELKNGFTSTGFSENSSPVIDYGSILTENQRRIATASGMSYKQYAELLAQIPTKKLNYKN